MFTIKGFYRTGRDHKSDDFTAVVDTPNGLWCVCAYDAGPGDEAKADDLTHLIDGRAVMTVTSDDNIDDIINHGPCAPNDVPYALMIVIGMEIERRAKEGYFG